ncbi:MAG TPA: deoxyribonuclease IV [Mycobacteriales bacterium]|nr:deoxyribonuclease IV [Mycobacteriales bacterium]
MPPRKPSPVGGHVIGGTGSGISYARRVGAEALQVFVSNPRGWAVPKPALAADAAFADECRDHRLALFVHAPYLVNLASPTARTREQSIASLRHCMERSTRLGARGVVVHAGSAVDRAHRDMAVGVVRDLLAPMLDDLTDESPDLLIEPTAGGGEALASSVEDLEPLFTALGHHPRLGVCLDTCHAFAAGHDLATPGGVRRTLNSLVRAVGRGRLKLVHANDSKDGLGSKRDRHTPVGQGSIGTEPFAELFRHPATRGVPVIIETPGGVDGHRRDIELLKQLRDR